jgi:GNAT superfamily N-acetyltransferase
MQVDMDAMFSQLPPGETRRAKALFKDMLHNLAVASILSGGTVSTVMVDDVDRPRAAVTWSGSRIYVAGDTGGDLFSSLAKTIAWKAEVTGSGVYVVYLAPEANGDDFMEPEGFQAVHRTRNYYEVDAAKRGWVAEPPPGYTLHMVDRSLLSMGLKNTDRVIDDMRSERPTVEEFLEKSFGFCAVAGGEIACWCMSEYNTGARFEIGIETAGEHRRRGLAMQTAKATIGYGVARGYRIVGWHCWTDNVGSNELARALGFSHVCKYPAIVLRRAASAS